MKKIILSVAVAAMALSTTASALEDIKVNGQAKLWYETTDAGDASLTDYESSTGEVVFKLGMTGKQGNVGFGVTMYQNSTMGLESLVVGNNRSDMAGTATNSVVNTDPWVGEAYVTAPIAGSNVLKFGKQELSTPLLYTEKWNATPNTFNAAVLVNNSVNNLTLIGAYVGQNAGSTQNIDAEQAKLAEGAFAIGGMYKTDAFGVNVWAYQVNGVEASGDSVAAYWVDASVKAGPVALKAYGTSFTNDGDATTGGLTGESTSAVALSAAMKAGEVGLFAAATTVLDEDGDMSVANMATGGKKTKLPTAAVYTDGKYIALPGSTSFKLKASGKLGTTGLALQAVMNTNTDDRNLMVDGENSKDTTEVDLIVTQKLGDFNFKAILMGRSFASDFSKAGTAQDSIIHARLITSVNF